MVSYLARTLVQLAITLVGIVTVVFFLMRAIPGDPALYMLGDFATEDAVAALRHRLGLDLPVYQQYLIFMERALTGDLGRSVVTGQPALVEVLNAVPWSLSLAVAGLSVAVLLGVPLGILSAVKQGTWVDTTIMLVALMGISSAD